MSFSHDSAHFAHDTVVALADAAALVNTRGRRGDELADQAGWDLFLKRHPYSGRHLRTDRELAEVRELRERLRGLWMTKDRGEAAVLVNDILREANAQPYLTKHDELDWHLHLTPPDAPVAHRIGAEIAMAFLDLIREDDLDRLRTCAADDCSDVLIDMSKNRSKRYCDTGNCGNRTNVAAYRARQRAARAQSTKSPSRVGAVPISSGTLPGLQARRKRPGT